MTERRKPAMRVKSLMRRLEARRRLRRGAAAVEFAIVLPILLGLLMGIVEFAMIGHHKLTLVQGVRAGAREGSIGKPLADIQAKVVSAATNIALTEDDVIVEYNTSEDGSGSWVTATDTPLGASNAVPQGHLLRVRIEDWPHPLVTGTFFAWLPGVAGNQLPLDAQMVMRRE